MSDQAKYFQIARRYVTALYDLLEKKEVKAFLEDIQGFRQAYHGSRDLVEYLKNPLIDPTTKTQVLRQIFPQSSKSTTIQHFFGLLCQKKRETILMAICDSFEQRAIQDDGKALCVITTARPVSAKTIKAIQDRIKDRVKKEVVVRTEIDEQLLGGFRAEVDGTVLDGSIRAQLLRMKNQILRNAQRN